MIKVKFKKKTYKNKCDIVVDDKSQIKKKKKLIKTNVAQTNISHLFSVNVISRSRLPPNVVSCSSEKFFHRLGSILSMTTELSETRL